MNDKSYIVYPIKRIAASVYDLFLLLGVWFAVGSFAVWINGGIIQTKWVGPLLVILSTWIFYGYFWMNGGKTLGMACLLYTSPSPRDTVTSRMPSSA